MIHGLPSPCRPWFQDRFDALMPALSKWGATMVGLTLLAIGILGIYETYFEKNNDHQNDAEVAEISELPDCLTNASICVILTDSSICIRSPLPSLSA